MAQLGAFEGVYFGHFAGTAYHFEHQYVGRVGFWITLEEDVHHFVLGHAGMYTVGSHLSHLFL